MIHRTWQFLCTSFIVANISLTAQADQKVHMANGIKIGEVTANSTIIWTRLTQYSERNIKGKAFSQEIRKKKRSLPYDNLNAMEGSVPGIAGDIRIAYWLREGKGDKKWSQWQSVRGENDFTHQFTLSALRPGVAYSVAVEGRDFRSPNNKKDGPQKTIWGKEQKQWFFDTVKQSDATFKILISPTPIVGPDRKKGKNDNHSNEAFKHEGDELRRFISQQKNMVTIVGDRHWQYVSVDPATGIKEFSVGPTADEHASGFSQKDKSSMHKFLRIKGGFLSAKIIRINGTPTITLRHHGVDGIVYNEDIIKAE